LSQNSWFKIRDRERSSFYVARQQTRWLVFLYFVAGMASASAPTRSSIPTAEAIVARMAQARAENRTHLRPYTVTRDYKLFGKDTSTAKSEVFADVAFVPPASKNYTIGETNGSGLGQILVRRMLANEVDVTRDYVSTDYSAENYDFRFLREADLSGQHCYVFELLPRRIEDHLLHGDIWVDAKTYLLRRFEGELAKTPSWWVKDVSVTFVYSDVGGMWLQTATEAAADVRIFGPTTMVSRDVKYKITELVATKSSVQINVLELLPGGPLRPGAIPTPPK
jgi:hypothetical protein